MLLDPTPTAQPLLPTPVSPDAATLFINRELSWLDFNDRVLQFAQDQSVPLLERVKYLAIFATNLDEFFMKRVGGLQRQREDRVTDRSLDGLTVDEQLAAIHKRVRPMLETMYNIWFDDLHPSLKRHGVSVRSYDDLLPDEQTHADEFFRRQVFPILTPLAVDPGHPFPFISNLSRSMGVMLEDDEKTKSFCRIKLPENLPRWVPLPDGCSFVALEAVIAANLGSLFPGMKVLEHHLFRVTRNADIEMDEEDADDLLALVTEELRKRRLAGIVRLELPANMSDEMRSLIIEGTDCAPEDVYEAPGPIDMDDLMALTGLDRPELKFKPWQPLVPPRLEDDADIFGVIRQGDLLVHHPYESFSASVERFIKAAAVDPKVLAIKQTLYRTSSDSPFVPALIRAAEAGKQVAVLVEIKARFDEQRNVELAQKLEKAGVHVVYGMVGLKTHSKLAMVVRDEPDGLRTYCHIGTGNYNSKTAGLYTDVGLFTANPLITGDVIGLFHHLTGRNMQRDYAKLLVAPVNMRDRFLQMVAREVDHAKAGRPARVVAKMNALQDDRIINALYDASRAGVKIDLIVRGFCCLRPGVPGLSDNIRVVSVLGRFLEHSRIYWFNNGGQDEVYLGSADWMVRNLDYRVEAITPVETPTHRETLKNILDISLQDCGHAWNLQADGSWQRVPPAADPANCVGTQETLMRDTLAVHKLQWR
ncbi:MAG: polyphosphate kinase 1 [Tepidisphaeraceae bacterium]